MKQNGWILILTFACAACGAPPADRPSKDEDTASAQSASWSYSEHLDEMRGQRRWVAQLPSANQAELDFPYAGGSPLILRLVKYEGEPPDNWNPDLVLANGQFDCSSSYGRSCTITMKVDDQPPEDIHAVVSDCGPNQCMRLHRNIRQVDQERPEMIALLRSAQQIIIEVPLYNYGSHQYRFVTQGLQWARETDRQ